MADKRMGPKLLGAKRKKVPALATLAAFLASISAAKEPMTPATVFKNVSPSVVVVEILDSGDSVVGVGSGVVVGEPNQIVTNRHVIDAGRKRRVRQGNKDYDALITYVDPDHDLALLKTDGLNIPPVSLRPSSTLAVGERVFAIGSPRGLELTLSEGLISGLRQYENGRVIQTSAAISPGSSGGGLFDEQGQLVGITSFGLTESQNLNFALPVEWVQALEAVARPQTPANQPQSPESTAAFFNAVTALTNLETFVWERRLLHDARYHLPQMPIGVSELLTKGTAKCIIEKKSPDCPDNWPVWQRASLTMLELRQEIQAAQPSRDQTEETFLDAARSAWSALADLYCKDRPGGFFTDLEEEVRPCSEAHGVAPASRPKGWNDQ